jgi:hypothetical protein
VFIFKTVAEIDMEVRDAEKIQRYSCTTVLVLSKPAPVMVIFPPPCALDLLGKCVAQVLTMATLNPNSAALSTAPLELLRKKLVPCAGAVQVGTIHVISLKLTTDAMAIVWKSVILATKEQV